MNAETHAEIEADIAAESDVEDLQKEKGFMVASQLKPEQLNKAVNFLLIRFRRNKYMSMQDLKKKKAQLAALGEWTHINGLHPTARDLVKDDILRRLLFFQEELPETPVAENQSRLNSLLSAVDLENLADEVQSVSVRDVPGGTASFIFERSSKVLVESIDETA